MATQLRGEHEADGGLKLAGTQGTLLVDAHQVGGLTRDAFELIIEEAVHNLHRTARHGHLAVDRLERPAHVHVPRALRLVGTLAARSGATLLRRGGGGLLGSSHCGGESK